MNSPIEALVKKPGQENSLEVGPAPPPRVGRQTEPKPHLPKDQGKPCSKATRIGRAPRRATRIQEGQQSALELSQPLTHLTPQGHVPCGTLFCKNARASPPARRLRRSPAQPGKTIRWTCRSALDPGGASVSGRLCHRRRPVRTTVRRAGVLSAPARCVEPGPQSGRRCSGPRPDRRRSGRPVPSVHRS